MISARDLAAHIVGIRDDPGVGGVPLCRAHADAVVVPLGWTLSDSRPAEEEAEFEPELVLVDDGSSHATGTPDALRLPMDEEAEEDMEEAAVGEIPPLLSRAFRAAGLD